MPFNIPFNRFFQLALLGMLCFWAIPAAADDLEASRQELRRIQEQIQTLSANLEQERQERGAVEKDLKGLQGQLTRLRAREGRLDSDLRSTLGEISTTEKDVAALQKQTRNRKELVARRLAAMYRGEEMRLLRILFSNRSPASIAEDYHLFKRVVEHDRRLLDGFRQDRQLLDRKLAELDELKTQQQGQMQQLQASRDTLQEGRRLKSRLLTQLQEREGSLVTELAGLQEKRERLAALVKKLESAPTHTYTQPAGSFARQKGRLGWPVRGRVKIPFGSGRLADLGTLYDSQGIEILVAGNQSIHAAWRGKVIYANAFRGYGKMIIIDHGDHYYTLYAQASSLRKKVGDLVEKGELIAHPGYEDADSVYFEVRYRGTPLNPLEWLEPRS